LGDRPGRPVRPLLIAVCAGAVLAIALRTTGLGLARVESGSMAPWAGAGDWVLLQQMSRPAETWVRRGEVVVFR
jgi:signal peptidase I